MTWLGPLICLVFYTVLVLALIARSDRDRQARIAAEMELARVTAHRDRLAEVLAHYESQLEVKDIRWVMARRGLVLLTLN